MRRRLRGLCATVLAAPLALIVACGDAEDADITGVRSGAETSGPKGGKPFSDPEGTYELVVGPDWVPRHGTIAAEVEVWQVAEPADAFAPNVNVLTQVFDGDLAEYLDLSIESGDTLIEDFRLIDRKVVEGTSGERLGVLEYTGSQQGRQLHFLQTIAVGSGTAVVATLTAPEDRASDLRGDVEPYLLTLRAT
jgi:hypothetical protein